MKEVLKREWDEWKNAVKSPLFWTIFLFVLLAMYIGR